MNSSGQDEDAPMFSEAEKEEIKATQEALRDVYGIGDALQSDANVSESVLSQARVQLEEALTKLTGELEEAYQRAKEKAPQLIESESNWDRFLQANKYDPAAAAENLALYWKKRYEVFGERAFLPLRLTNGQGALSQEVVDSLKLGWMCVLPSDEHNRPVLFADESRRQGREQESCSQEQVLFYNLQLIFDTDQGLKNGFVCTLFLENKPLLTSYSTFVSLLKSEAVPVDFKCIHMIALRDSKLMETTIPVLICLLNRSKQVRLRAVPHFVKAGGERFFLQKMKGDYGIFAHGMPRELGGALDFNKYLLEWIQDPTAASALALDTGAASDKNASEVAVPPRPEGAAASLAAEAKSQDSDESRDPEKKRKTDILYHRQKRKRNKQHETQLKEQVEKKREENWALEAEQKRLQMAWESAVDLVQKYTRDQQLMERSSREQVFPPVAQLQPLVAPQAAPARSAAVAATVSAYPPADAMHYRQQPQQQQPPAVAGTVGTAAHAASQQSLLDRLLLAGMNPSSPQLQPGQHWASAGQSSYSTDQYLKSIQHEQSIQQLLLQRESLLGHQQQDRDLHLRQHQHDEALARLFAGGSQMLNPLSSYRAQQQQQQYPQQNQSGQTQQQDHQQRQDFTPQDTDWRKQQQKH